MSMRWCPRCDARFGGEVRACPIDGTELERPSDPFVGTTVAGRYLIEEPLGSGGMGTVYRARHQIIGRDVALKFLDPALTKNERQRKRFLGEARAANQINHEHIIDIFDFGEAEDGLVYMVMEYLQGRTLWNVMQDGPMDPRRALRIALQVALGLARAHELGVVHRDIKPANIYLVQKRAERDFVKILDFGVARIDQDARITGQNMIVGTPEYIAPEQVRAGGAKPSSDLYAVGCMLFEMLTGQLPFEGKTTMLLVKHLNDPVPVPSSYLSTIPEAVDKVVVKLMQKRPEDRHRDGYHLVEDLQKVLDILPRGHVGGQSHGQLPAVSQGAPVQITYAEDGWERSVKLFQNLLQEAHPRGDHPPWLPQQISDMAQLLKETRALRSQLIDAAKKATAQEEEARRPRQQIGFALDQLAHDESRLGREIDALNHQLQPAEKKMDDAIHVVSACTRVTPLDLREGSTVNAPQSIALHDLVEATRALEDSRAIVVALKSKMEAKRAEHRDLSFQIEQLKDKMEAMHAISTCDMELAHDEVNRLDAQMQEKLDALAPLAEHISGYFNQYPELRERLASREQRGDKPDSRSMN